MVSASVPSSMRSSGRWEAFGENKGGVVSRSESPTDDDDEDNDKDDNPEVCSLWKPERPCGQHDVAIWMADPRFVHGQTLAT
jgi:hypothetical protein